MEEVIWNTLSEDYVRLSHLKRANEYASWTERSVREMTAMYENIIQEFDDINYAIPEGSPAERHSPKYVGYTALHFAVEDNQAAAVEELLDRGADPTLKNRNGFTPIRLSADTMANTVLHDDVESMEFITSPDNYKVLEVQGRLEHPILDALLSAQVRSGNTINASCKNGVSHFHLACMMDDKVAVKFFLDVGEVPVDLTVNQDSPILPGCTGLHFAVRHGSVDVFDVLLSRGSNMKLCDAEGLTPLQLLIKRSVQLAYGFHLAEDIKDFRFQYLCADLLKGELNANQKILNKLYSRNELMMELMDCGMSKLHLACINTTGERLHTIEKMIVEEKADVNAAIDAESSAFPGYTPLHFAAHFNVQTVLLLLKLGANIVAKDVEGVTPLDICVKTYKVEHLLLIIQSAKNLRDIKFTDGTQLSDAIHMIRNVNLINKKSFPYQVTLNSPLWPGRTILHLAVDFTRRIDHVRKIVQNYNFNNRLYVPGRKSVDQLSMEAVKKCLSLLNDISAQDANGMTPLHLAFRQQKEALVEYLIGEIGIKGMTTNPSDFGNLSYLHIMSVKGRANIISDYLNKYNDRIDLNGAINTGFKYFVQRHGLIYVESNSTALHLAVISKNDDVVQVLLKHGADLLSKDVNGLNPLQFAFTRDYFNTYSMRSTLFSAYKQRNVIPMSSEGLSYFLIACLANDLSIVKGLIECELADLEATINCSGSRSDCLDDEVLGTIKSSAHYISRCECSRTFLLPQNYCSGYRALHVAVEKNALEIFELLLNCGADTQVRTTTGFSPLQLALRNVSNQRSRDIVIRLTETETGLYDGLTKLHIACVLRDEIAITKALEAGIEIDSRLSLSSPIWPGSTVLHILLEDWYYDSKEWSTLEPIIKLLVSHGANVNQLNSKNLSPIHIAYEKGCLDAVRLMLASSRILESNPIDVNGFSHFHIACCLAEDSLVEKYLVLGLANVNYPTDYYTGCDYPGFAPIHFALANRNYTTVEILLRHGANVLAKDCYKSTILHVAVQMIYDNPNRNIIETAILNKCIIPKLNMNAVNIYGETPLEKCLLLDDNDGLIELFLKHGAQGIFVNPISGEGILGLANEHAAKIILENAKDIADIDHVTGFNAIHNIVSRNISRLNSFQLGQTIEQLIQKGCDIDLQDIKGKTPLHVALAWEENSITVEVLLKFGADINIVDNWGSTPLEHKYVYNYESPAFPNDRIVQSLFVAHINTILYFGFYLHPKNYIEFDNAKYYLSLHGLEDTSELALERWKSRLRNQLEDVRKIVIYKNYTLENLLSKKTVQVYPRLARSEREAIASSLSFENMRKIMPKSNNLVGLLRLQHRRCLIRMQMMEPAKIALRFCAKQFISNYLLPDLCSEIIITLLTNEEMMSLIKINKH